MTIRRGEFYRGQYGAPHEYSWLYVAEIYSERPTATSQVQIKFYFGKYKCTAWLSAKLNMISHVSPIGGFVQRLCSAEVRPKYHYAQYTLYDAS